MRKREELAVPDSCWNKAGDDERLFVLLERDMTMPDVIRYWVAKRIEKGVNREGDAQLEEALGLAQAIEDDHRECDIKHLTQAMFARETQTRAV